MLMDADRLAEQLDPEDHYDLMQIFRDTSLPIISQHDGYVAQHLDHGLLVYFGYPQAYEDVRSGRFAVVWRC